MYKGIVINDTSVNANTNIPFTTVRNTNSNTRYDSTNNEVDITSEGYYDILSTIVVTATTSAPISARLIANGIAVSGAVSTMTPSASETTTLTLVDNVKVGPALFDNVANISVQLSADATVNDAILLVEKRK